MLRVGEFCRVLNMPKSSVSRTLKTLSGSGLIEREQGEYGYVPGRLALELGELYRTRHTLLELVDKTIDRIVSKFGFAGYGGVLSGHELVILRVKHGTYPLRFVQPAGRRIPAFDTAIGRALLARLEPGEAIALAATDTGQSVRARRAELAEVRRTGLARTESLVVPGIVAIGAAIVAANSHEQIGFSISFPVSAVATSDQRAMEQWLREEAARLASKIGDTYWEFRVSSPNLFQRNRQLARTGKPALTRAL